MKPEKNEPRPIEFLITAADYRKIDHIIQALSLAVAEILSRKRVVERPYPKSKAQWDYDERINAILDTGDLI
jgi:arsenate reductase-like glutaredoxin family protein